MRVVDTQSSVELAPLERGRLRLWLATHAEICRVDTRQPSLHDELQVHLKIAPGRATGVDVVAAHGMPRAMAACLARGLRRVAFGELAPRFTWSGTLVFEPDGGSIEARVESLHGTLDGVILRSVVLSALEQPAECTRRFFAATPVLSAALVAKLDAAGAHVVETSVSPDGTVACVASLLAGLRWSADQLRDAELRIWLLRPTTEVDPSAPLAKP